MRGKPSFLQSVGLVVSICLSISFSAVFAAGNDDWNYSLEGKAVAAACIGHLEGKPKFAELGRSNYSQGKTSTGFGITTKGYGKRSATIPKVFISLTFTGKKGNDLTKNRCLIIIGFGPNPLGINYRIYDLPEFKAFERAFFAEFQSKGYKRVEQRSRMYLVGKKMTYQAHRDSPQFSAAWLEIIPR